MPGAPITYAMPGPFPDKIDRDEAPPNKHSKLAGHAPHRRDQRLVAEAKNIGIEFSVASTECRVDRLGHFNLMFLTRIQLPPHYSLFSGLDIPAGEKDFVIRDSYTLPVATDADTDGSAE